MSRLREIITSFIALSLVAALSACATSGPGGLPGTTPGTGHMWVPVYYGSSEAESLPNSTLGSSGPEKPDVTVGGAAGDGLAAAFDGAGNLWVSDYNGYVYRYNAADLGSTGTPTPAVTIDASASGASFYGMAFDAAGDLWVSDYTNDQLLMYTPQQLNTGGTVPPKYVISDDGSGSLASPGGIAFDASGALWVADYNNSTVVKFLPSQLGATASPTPNVIISASGGSLSYPNNVAFDSNGNLWVSNDSAGNTGTVVRFDTSQLGGGSPAPAATIASTSLGGNPAGLAFDASGALWIADSNSDDLRKFANPGAMTGTVTRSADVTITGVGNGSIDYAVPAFDPPPSNLPINAP